MYEKKYQTMLYFAGGLEIWFCALIKFSDVTYYKSISLSQSSGEGWDAWHWLGTELQADEASCDHHWQVWRLLLAHSASANRQQHICFPPIANKKNPLLLQTCFLQHNSASVRSGCDWPESRQLLHAIFAEQKAPCLGLQPVVPSLQSHPDY